MSQPPPAEDAADEAARAAFRAAVADVAPLPPSNRAQIYRPPPPLVVRPWVVEKPPAAAQTWPTAWQTQGVEKTTVDPERAAFERAMAGVDRLPEPNRARLDGAPPAPLPRQRQADEQAALHESLHGFIALQDRLEGGDEPHYLAHGVAQNVLRDLRRGRWVIQGELDLHGMNREEARHALSVFLHDAVHQGARCVRIIHGKGHGSPQKLSILRQLVRGWLMQRRDILAYCQARPQDGGEGALLALLRAAHKRLAQATATQS